MGKFKTPGRQLVAELSKALLPGTEWTQVELQTLTTIETMSNRLDALRRRTDAAIADPQTKASEVSQLCAQTRALEVSLDRLCRSLDPEMVSAKSARHVAAANARWTGVGTVARLVKPSADPNLREELILDAQDFRLLMVSTMLDEGPEAAQFAWDHCSRPVDALQRGEAVQIHRYQLPDAHPLSTLGGPCDLLTVEADGSVGTG